MVVEEVKEQGTQIDSTVLIKGAEELKVLEEALDGKKFRLELKYRGTRDGFSAQNFHKVVDGMYNTLTVVESEHGFRFGGYSSVKYGSSNSRVPDPNGVIFSLTKKSVHRQYQNKS